MSIRNAIERSPLLRWSESFSNVDNVLLCFPHAGGGSSFYRPWLRAHNNLAIVPLQLPGREERGNEVPYKNMDILLDDILNCMHSFSGKNIYLFGHSMGAIIATALATTLKNKGQPLEHLFVSGSIAPHYRDPRKKLHHLDKEQLWEKVLSFNGTPSEIACFPDLLLMMEKRLRADLELCENWSLPANEKMSCKLSVFYGDGDLFLNKSGLIGWQELVTQKASYHSFSGEHFYIKQHMLAVLDFIYQAIGDTSYEAE